MARTNPAFLVALVASLLICGPTMGQDDSNLRGEGYHDKDPKDKSCQQVFPPTEKEFHLDVYIGKSWFVTKQQVNPYQSENDLFCVTATYNKRLDGRVQVLNFGREGSIDGPEQVPPMNFFTELCAEQLFGAKLRVGPCILGFLPAVFYGPYWIVALGIDEVADDYSWAIVSAGNPDVFIERRKGVNFCTTTNSTCFLDINGSGLWLFTRERVAPEETIAEMEDKLKELGIYAGGLKDVTQAGCSYPSFIKT